MQKYFSLAEFPKGVSSYRGLQRIGPYPLDDGSDSADFMRAFEAYSSSGERFEHLLDIMPLWGALGIRQSQYEIILVTTLEAEVEGADTTFLGCDITSLGGWNSILDRRWTAIDMEPWDRIRPHLNEYLLLKSVDDAKEVSGYLESFSSQHSSLIESVKAEQYSAYKVYSILVREDNKGARNL